MARPNRFQIMELYLDDITNAFTNLNKKVLTMNDISAVLKSSKKVWRLPELTTAEDIKKFLLKKKIITLLDMDIERFVFTNETLTIHEIASNLFPNAYLSHYSAVSFHDFTNEIIKVIYLSREQTPKGEPQEQKLKTMTQSNIDAAFAKPMRRNNKFISLNNHKIYLLNGRFTNNLGVFNYNGINVTNIERTLIDIVVRPEYAGGVYEVLNIFKNAKGKASTNKIKAYLSKLQYIYPYHQAIGFYLEKAEFSQQAIDLLDAIPKKYDFYLTYNINELSYSEKWKLYYPKDFV